MVRFLFVVAIIIVILLIIRNNRKNIDLKKPDIYKTEKIESSREQSNRQGRLEVIENKRTWLVLELEDEDPPVLVVLLVKVPVATEETASAVLVAAESLSHLATRGAALTAAAIKAKVETAFVNFILTDVYVCCCGEKRLLG